MILASTIEIYAGGPGSGCRGPNCGRTVTIYHGTTEDNLPAIYKKGLDPKKSARTHNKRAAVYLSTSRKMARFVANHRHEFSDTNSKGVVLRLDLPEEFARSLRKDDDSFARDKAFYSTRRIPPEYIHSVEKL